MARRALQEQERRVIRTGDQYKESIRDDRVVYIDGERIKDVTRHPMFKPLIDIRARIYDMQHDPKTRAIMTVDQEGETVAVTQKLPYEPADWHAKRRAVDAVMWDVGGIVTRVGDETVGEMWVAVGREGGPRRDRFAV